VELQRVLPGISTEQLRSRLNRMVADGMLTRKRYREVPPRVDYELTERARELMPILAELARWGYEWAWGPPRGSEHVDIGAIFRLAPGLVNPGGAQGTIEFTINDGKQDGEAATFTFTLAGDRVMVAERAVDNADGRASGDVSDWVNAFSPERNRGGLDVRGDQMLVDRLLDGLALTHSRARSHASAA
jgi:hypothetical protein